MIFLKTIKKIISILVCAALLCVLPVQSVSAENIFPSEEINVVVEPNSPLGTDFYDDSHIISTEINNGVMRTLYSVNWTVEAGTTSTATSQATLSPGDYYYFDLSFSPAPSGTISLGGYNRTNSTYYSISTSAASYNKFVRMTVAGTYSMRIRNNTSSDITVTGTYEAVKFVGSTSLNVPLYQQETNVWCWAACIEMCAEYMGYTTTQYGIVEAADALENEYGGTASDYTKGMLYATNNEYTATRTSTVLSASAIKNILASNVPVIIGIGTYSDSGRDGHANVVIAVDQDNKYIRTNDPNYYGCSVKTYKYSVLTDSTSTKRYDSTIQITENE